MQRVRRFFDNQATRMKQKNEVQVVLSTDDRKLARALVHLKTSDYNGRTYFKEQREDIIKEHYLMP